MLIGKLEHLLVENISGHPVAERDWRQNTRRHATHQPRHLQWGPLFGDRN
jgi:hypothetical protein